MPELECGAVSTYCRDNDQWSYHCNAPDGHPAGEHTYVLDDGQTEPPLLEG